MKYGHSAEETKAQTDYVKHMFILLEKGSKDFARSFK